VKFIFFEDKNNVIVNKQQYNEEKKLITKKKEKEEYDDPTNRNNTNTIDADMPVIEVVFPLSDEWEENPVEHANKEVQTNAIWLGTSNSNDESELSKKFETPRSLEDCIEIYKSKVRLLYRTIFNFVLSVIPQSCIYVHVTCRQCFIREKIILVMLDTGNIDNYFFKISYKS